MLKYHEYHQRTQVNRISECSILVSVYMYYSSRFEISSSDIKLMHTFISQENNSLIKQWLKSLGPAVQRYADVLERELQAEARGQEEP